MITAKEAKNRTLESDKIKEILKGKQYEGICEDISNHIVYFLEKIFSHLFLTIILSLIDNQNNLV